MAPATPGRAAKKQRIDVPATPSTATTSRQFALQAAATSDSRQAALAELLQDTTAASARRSVQALWITWTTFHAAWFGQGTPTLPLTPTSVLSVAASFKAGRYKSFATYLSKAKEQHISAGHAWTDELALAARKATTSVLRGVGTARQSTPFDLDKALLVADKVPAQLASPLGWSRMMVIGVAFIMREIELAAALVRHVLLDFDALQVTLQLPASKRDSRAIGCSRTLACNGPRPGEH